MQLTRFINYCCKSESIKADHLFEKFLDENDYASFVALSKKTLAATEEIKHLEKMIPLAGSANININFSSPDDERVKKAKIS